MTAVIIICVVLLLLFFLLASSVKMEFEYDQGVFVKIKYLFITVLMLPKTERQKRKEAKEEKKQKIKEEKRQKREKRKLEKMQKKQAKKKRKTGAHIKTKEHSSKNKPVQSKKKTVQSKGKASPKPSHKENASKKEKIELSQTVQCVKQAKPYVKRIFKKIRIYDVFAEIIVGGEDAAKTAISYGIHCAAVYGFSEFLKNTVHFKEKKITVKADFDNPKTDYYIYAKIKLRLSTLLYCVIWGFSAVTKALNENPESSESAKSNTQDNHKRAA